MKLAEYCHTSPGYIGEIEIGRKFPSTEMIEKIAQILRIEPYHLFKNHMKKSKNSDAEKVYPPLSNTMKNEIKSKINTSIDEIFDTY